LPSGSPVSSQPPNTATSNLNCVRAAQPGRRERAPTVVLASTPSPRRMSNPRTRRSVRTTRITTFTRTMMPPAVRPGHGSRRTERNDEPHRLHEHHPHTANATCPISYIHPCTRGARTPHERDRSSTSTRRSVYHDDAQPVTSCGHFSSPMSRVR
jgi:hypothetical protein